MWISRLMVESDLIQARFMAFQAEGHDFETSGFAKLGTFR